MKKVQIKESVPQEYKSSILVHNQSFDSSMKEPRFSAEKYKRLEMNKDTIDKLQKINELNERINRRIDNIVNNFNDKI